MTRNTRRKVRTRQQRVRRMKKRVSETRSRLQFVGLVRVTMRREKNNRLIARVKARTMRTGVKIMLLLKTKVTVKQN